MAFDVTASGRETFRFHLSLFAECNKVKSCKFWKLTITHMYD